MRRRQFGWLLVLPCLLAGSGEPWAGLRQSAPKRQALVRLARQAALAHFAGRPAPRSTAPEPVEGGVFVTLLDGTPSHPTTRACWGNLHPEEPRLAEAVSRIAVAALSQDYRQRPVGAAELPRLRFAISLVGPLIPVSPGRALRPKTEGLYLTDGSRGAVLLPGEALTGAWQEATCRRKAGIAPRARAYRYRFHTLVIEEPTH